MKGWRIMKKRKKPKKPAPRNLYAVDARLRKAGPMKDRRRKKLDKEARKEMQA